MKTKKITEMSLLLAVSLVLSYLETLLPVFIAVPGVKLGLANVVTMLILYCFDAKNAFFFMTLRVVMAGFLFSGISGIIYSFVGGLFCILIISLTKRMSCFSTLGVSMSGAIFHNLGQIIVAFFVMENAHILYYFPVLCVSGVLTGLVIGYLTQLILKHYSEILPKD